MLSDAKDTIAWVNMAIVNDVGVNQMLWSLMKTMVKSNQTVTNNRREGPAEVRGDQKYGQS